MTTAPAFGHPAALPRRSRVTPRGLAWLRVADVGLHGVLTDVGLGILTLGILTGAGLLLPAPGPLTQELLSPVVAGAAAAYLLRRAPGTTTPLAWRLYAGVLVLASAGAIATTAVTGLVDTGVLGSLPGQLLAFAALTRLARPGYPRRWRGHLTTTAPLFLVATLLVMRLVMQLVPLGGASPILLRVAVSAVPLAVAVCTAAVLVFAAGCGPARQPVAVLLLTGQAFWAWSCTAALFAWGTGSSTVRACVWPAMLAAVLLLCLAARRDRRPATPEQPAPLPGLNGFVALLPHAMALLAGCLLLARIGATGRFDAVGSALILIGLGFLVGHQAVMWRAHRRLTGDLLRSESFFRTLVRSSVDPVVIVDDQLRVTFASRSIVDLLGFDPDCVAGRRIADAIHPDDAPMLLGALGDTRRGDGATVRTARLRHADGRWRLIQATVRDLRGVPDVDALVFFCRDVTPAIRAHVVDPELIELSLTDPVTGLPNRTALVRRLGAVQRGGPGARPAALAVIGVSGLAAADDAGPGAEDTVLRALTTRLTGALRGEDWLARGKNGDFVVLVDGTIADAETVAARLVGTVRALRTAAGPLPLTAWAGVTNLPADVDPGEALRRCGVALRSARHDVPGSVHRYDDALRMEQDRRQALRTDLDGAVERGELRLVFQPVVDLVLHRTVSVEALLRWRHPVFGEVSPVEFVPLAEESPLIGDVGRWVLREACTTIAALPGTDLSVAVNVSARQVRSGELVADVLAALEASGLPASRLIVEITESVLLDDAHVIEDLAVLRELGVRIAVDDFGTGWSSLAYLVGLPVDTLKMDQHFLANMEHDAQRQALCRAVLQLGSSLGLPVIVEGVTTETELGLLRDMGHRYLQGFFLARPLETAQLTAGGWRTAIAVPAAAHVPAIGGRQAEPA